MKIGVFGGAFNPVHKGHIDLADNVYNAVGLDKLLFIPTFKPPHKSGGEFAPAQDRLNMLKLALDGKPYEISLIEFERNEKSYTFDTLCALEKTYPNARFYLIIGSDQFLSFADWYRYRDILAKAVLCTAARDSQAENKKILAYAERLGVSGGFFLSDKPVLRVSSSEIRQGVKNGENVGSLLPDGVFDYITEKGLYRV